MMYTVPLEICYYFVTFSCKNTRKERKTMKIIKRNGSEVDFDLSKIIVAVSKANKACDKE